MKLMLWTVCMACYLLGPGMPLAGTDEKEAELSKQRNRKAAPADNEINRAVTMEGLMNSKDDEKIFGKNSAAVLEGYVYSVIGQKSGLCDSSAGCDFLIYLAKDDKANKTADCMLVVITPATLALNPKLNWGYLKGLSGRHVKITGWLLFDYPQTKTSYETHPNGFKVDRRTAWEIYPATSVKIDE